MSTFSPTKAAVERHRIELALKDARHRKDIPVPQSGLAELQSHLARVYGLAPAAPCAGR